jgi:hypothetical protein
MSSSEKHEGFLLKKSRILRQWNKWWFVLQNGELRWFKSKETTKMEGGCLVKDRKCGGVTGNQKFPHCFQVETPKRVFFFCATTKEEYNQWKTKITEHGGNWDGELKRRSVVHMDGCVVKTDAVPPLEFKEAPSGSPDSSSFTELPKNLPHPVRETKKLSSVSNESTSPAVSSSSSSAPSAFELPEDSKVKRALEGLLSCFSVGRWQAGKSPSDLGTLIIEWPLELEDSDAPMFSLFCGGVHDGNLQRCAEIASAINTAMISVYEDACNHDGALHHSHSIPVHKTNFMSHCEEVLLKHKAEMTKIGVTVTVKVTTPTK